MASKNRSRKKKRSAASAPRVAKPKKRLPASFDVLGEVTRTADMLMQKSRIENIHPNRTQAGMFVRGINALRATQALAEQSQWEFAAGPVRQLFELVINTEELLRQSDLDEALKQYVKFGLMQEVRSSYESLAYARDTGRDYDAERLAVLEKMLESGFAEFRHVSNKGRVWYDQSWCRKTARKLAEESSAAVRQHQYRQLYSTWSEQVHASPSTLLDDIFGAKPTDLEGLLQADEPRTAEVITMGIVLFIELWRLLPVIPDPEEQTVNAWASALTKEALRWRVDGLPPPPTWPTAGA